jgi:hypothetical protein
VSVDEISFKDGGIACLMDDLVITTNVGERIANVEVYMVGEDKAKREVIMGRKPRSMSDLNIMQQEAVLKLLRYDNEAWGCLLDFKHCA